MITDNSVTILYCVGRCNYDLYEDICYRPNYGYLWWGRIRDQGLHQDTVLGHFLVILPCNVSLEVQIGMTSQDLWLSSHKG
jgi:hypothetical protein